MWSQQEGIIDTFRYSVVLWCVMFVKFSKFFGLNSCLWRHHAPQSVPEKIDLKCEANKRKHGAPQMHSSESLPMIQSPSSDRFERMKICLISEVDK